ncbi:CHAT domain-containing protein [Microcoleus sp. FACHB-1515]|uniref:CHAT domain-containing protein n=1 Tax=Cyanophyceae TaxID=3028117 RepID=UPI001689E33F|nr:CHAT domain-containing protein [Microcoleus sp. FACHB-1515]MBD2091275.1 CHAT domain-containing protein [Microcoleus sp. FACHB-1515]
MMPRCRSRQRRFQPDRTLLYAPDGQLRYTPLAALYDGQQWLAQRYRVNNITAESLTEPATQPRRNPHTLTGVFADVGIE